MFTNHLPDRPDLSCLISRIFCRNAAQVTPPVWPSSVFTVENVLKKLSTIKHTHCLPPRADMLIQSGSFRSSGIDTA